MAASKVNKAIAALVLETKQKALAEFAEFLKEEDTEGVDELIAKFTDAKIAEKEKEKKPPTAYRLFLQDKMKELKEADPNMKGRIAMTEAARLWTLQKEQNGDADAKPKAAAKGKAAAKPTKVEIVSDSEESEKVDDTAHNSDSDSDSDDEKKASALPTIKEKKETGASGKGKAGKGQGAAAKGKK